MANEYANSYMALISDLDEVEFIGASSNFRYLDDTLQIETPDVEESRFSSLAYSGRSLKDVVYKSRQISFEFEVYGTSDNDVLTNTARLQRMISLGTSPFSLAGGAYEANVDYASSSTPIPDTGDVGIVFGVRLGRDAATSYTSELGISTTNKNILYSRVLRAKMTNSERYFTMIRTKNVNGATKYYRTYKMDLECEPYMHMPARQVVTVAAPGLREGLVSPINSNINRIIIPAASIAGTEPAPTRIVTHLAGAQAIIIGRDAGISALNCPSFPVMTTGSGKDDIYVMGDIRSATGKTYKVKISATGGSDSFQVSINGGAYSGSQSITALQKYQLGSDNAYIYFESATGHTLNNEWTFYSHQTVKNVNVTYDVYANRSSAYTETGTLVTSIYYVIPPGCHSRYKLYGKIAKTGYTPEVSSKIYYGGYNDLGTGKLYSGGAQFDWTTPPSPSNWVDLGLIDLTANSLPSFMHPGAYGEVKIEVYTRSLSTISNPATLTLDLVYMVPCPDENSWFHAGWIDDGDQYEHYCNYDMANPYMIESIPSGYGTYGRSMPLNGTYGGNFITLIPNVDNTIMMVPLDSIASDWRRSEFLGIGETGYTAISYRPTYLVL